MEYFDEKSIKKVPMPIVGTMHGIAALGNLVQSYGDIYRNILGIIAGIIFIIVTIKFMSGFEDLRSDLNTPIGGSVFPSWFIVYVGIAVAAVTGKAFYLQIGQAAFWFGFLTAKGYDTGVLSVIVNIEELIAVILVFYVLIRFILFIAKGLKSKLP